MPKLNDTMKKNELVLLLGKKNFLVHVDERKLHTEFGVINLSELLKKKFGDKIKSHTNEIFTIVKPTIIDILMKKAKRLPQIITPDDASLILSTTGIAPSSIIVDAGSGSGFLAIFLAHYCQQGKIITYEKNSKFAKVVTENIRITGLKNINVKQKDILKGIQEKNIDMITLDMKDAERMVAKCYNALKPGGWLVVYSPYIEQVKRIVEKFEKSKFTHVKTIENTRRDWQVANYTRPHTLGVMHTGWLTFARKV